MNVRERRQNAKTLSVFLMVLFAGTGIAVSQTGQGTADDARMDRVLNGLRPPIIIKGQPAVQWTLAERMALNHVPGVSIAVIDQGRIAWVKGVGTREAGATSPVVPSTLFEAQSISKAVASTATLALVSSGKLSLDAPVNDYLKSWKIPENEFQVHEKVTLRRILSHSAGLTVSGFDGYRSGDTLPTLLQILDGEKPANSPPIRVDTVPGSIFRYSGGGMEVMQQMLMDVTGQSFPALMKQLVLAPTGMTSSTYEQPLPQARWTEAASGHDNEGAVIKGKWPIQTEMAAAGLWTTPTDLAKWALAITKAWSGTENKLLSKPIAMEMLTTQKAPYGLGVEVDSEGESLQFSHAGSNAGYRTLLVMFPALGKGAVIMTNGDRGENVINGLITSIAAEYHWPARTQVEREVVPLSDAQINNVVGVYSLPPAPSGSPVTYEVTRVGSKIFGELKGLGPRPRSELFSSSPTSFFGLGGLMIDFVLDDSGRATSLKFGPFIGVRKP